MNAALNFGDGSHTPHGATGAVGQIVGEPGDGLRQMFHMMNEARVGVGLSAAAVGSAGYALALDYARVREQGRSSRAADPGPVPIIEHTDVRRMLLAAKSYVEGGLALSLYCALLVDDAKTCEAGVDRERSALLLDVLTPIAKSWPSQWCLEANALAIQVHGGYGYTREYDVVASMTMVYEPDQDVTGVS
ncbi:acyl-CoA dehydrogenase family protein [Rhodococcus olei]|uniref:acyl-CoA dehydrogenase family protein n=1 Tax=Rhodococcus olei TaxID=2161675 RepID=UPI0031F0EC73